MAPAVILTSSSKFRLNKVRPIPGKASTISVRLRLPSTRLDLSFTPRRLDDFLGGDAPLHARRMLESSPSSLWFSGDEDLRLCADRLAEAVRDAARRHADGSDGYSAGRSVQVTLDVEVE